MPWTDPELRRAVRVAFERLPERERLVVALRDVRGLGSEEVCELLQLSAEDERALLHRGRTAVCSAVEDLLEPAAATAA